ncbi:hypothetical protein T4B_13554 [Trichinella pseudospiralis]|uniref:Uncharacterized protein n=1 Tax=Trichinella pseudospiralis TaxID=6337 RepID=A0A0V1GHB6_TRIPS|nr:hypothetical protein T4B_13554 [Trichinella pseudospiralis]
MEWRSEVRISLRSGLAEVSRKIRVEKHAERYKMEVDLLKKNGICMLAHDQTLRWGRKVVEDKMAPYL